MLNQYEDILTIEDLCEILLIGKNCAYRMLTENKIEAFRIGKKWKIPKASVESFIRKNTSGGS